MLYEIRRTALVTFRKHGIEAVFYWTCGYSCVLFLFFCVFRFTVLFQVTTKRTDNDVLLICGLMCVVFYYSRLLYQVSYALLY